ncbi:hypothetical protein TNCV_1698691 [Trichonephila clavipes]|nr:hypothetical protein TNCV_1698691 [Trichonephila clavipes]
METGFSKFFRSSVRDAEIILRAGQRIISEINILVENSQGSFQIPKSNPQLLNAEIKKKIARHENIKIIQTNTVNLDMQDYLEKKLENMLTSFQAILEKQTTLIMEASQKTMESVLSHLSKVFEMGKSSPSPLRKKKAVVTDTNQKLNILQLNNRFINHPQLQADMFADYFASKNAYREPLPLDFLYDKNSLLNKSHSIFLSSCSYTRVFGDGPRNFEPWSSDEDDT